MKVKSLQLTDFRNHKKEVFNFHDGVNIIVGKNGAGKTNVLEAIYMALLAKSFRAQDEEVIKDGEDGFRVVLETEDKTFTIGYTQEPLVQKKNLVDGIEVSPSELIGTKPAVLFEPNDVKIIEDSPSWRRRFFNQLLSQTDKSYLKDLITYRRILKQRNALLKKEDIKKDHVFAWDVNLSQAAGRIVKTRKELLEFINEHLPEVYKALSDSEFKVTGQYDSKITNEDYGSAMMEQLNHLLPRDQRRGYTSIGPHRDDITFLINEEAELALMASRGEMRTTVLALKIMEADYIRKQTDEEPLILLDDVFSELDDSRQKLVLERFSDFQTIITTTSIKDVSISSENVIRL